jgi:hypothetical protein
VQFGICPGFNIKILVQFGICPDFNGKNKNPGFDHAAPSMERMKDSIAQGHRRPEFGRRDAPVGARFDAILPSEKDGIPGGAPVFNEIRGLFEPG